MATTVYYVGVVTAQVGNALACRSDRARSSMLGWLSNPGLWLAILIELLGVVSLTQLPFIARLFNHVPLPGWIWLGLACYAPVLYSIEWIRKAVLRRIRSTRNGKSSTLSLQEVRQ